MDVQKRFEFLEHMADAYIAAYGRNLAEAFENAAYAMFEVMTDVGRVEPKLEEIIEVEGHDECSLLYNWLESLLVRFETEGILYSRFEVLGIESLDGYLRWRARVAGEHFNPDQHVQKVGVKAVTYHMMKVERKPDGVTLRFLLDL